MAKGKTIAKYAVSIIADTDQLNKGFKDITKGAKKFGKEVDTQSKKTKKSFGSMFKGLKTGWLLVAGVMTGVVVAAFKKVIGLASDFQEQNSKFKTVFRGTVSEAQNFRKELTSAYGLSRLEATKFLASTQDLLVPLGIARDKATELSASTVKLARDMASFNNLPTSDVLRDVHSAMTGMFVPLKKYGVIINETILKQEAANRGIALTNGMVDAQSKALIALDLIAKGSADAIGDFARTEQSFANQTKIAASRISDMAVSFGSALLPMITPIVSKFNDLITKQTEIEKITKNLTAAYIEYSDVVKILEGDLENLTTAEVQVFKNRKELAKMAIESELRNYQEEYVKWNKINEETQKNELDNLKIKISYAEDEYTIAARRQAQVIADRKAGKGYYGDLEAVNERLANATSHLFNLRTKLVSLEEEEAELIGKWAKLYNDGNDALDLTVLTSEKLRDAILDRADELEKIQELQALEEVYQAGSLEKAEKLRLAEEKRLALQKLRLENALEQIRSLRNQLDLPEIKLNFNITEAEAEIERLKRLLDRAFRVKVATDFGKDLAMGLVSALNSGDAKSAASSLADSFADATGKAIGSVLEKTAKEMGWIGQLIATFMKLAKEFTGKGFTKFVNKVGKDLMPLISNIVETITTSLTDPRWLVKLVIQILRGIWLGIQNAIRNLFTVEWWRDFDWSFEDVTVDAQIEIDKQQLIDDIVTTINEAFAKADKELELKFKLGKLTDIELIEARIANLKQLWSDLPLAELLEQNIDINLELVQLYEDLENAQQSIIDGRIEEILLQDELLKQQIQAGIISGTEIENKQKILDILYKEKLLLENLAEEEGLIVEEMESYLSLLTEINGIEDQIVTANMAQTAELAAQDKLMQDQLDKTSELNRLRNVAKGILGTLGIPKFQLDFLQKQIDIASFGLQKDLFSGGGFDFGEIEKLLAASSGIFSGTMVPAEAQGIQDFFGSLSGMGGTTITNQIDSLIGTLNSSQPVSVSALKPILSALLVSLERESGNE
jgi:hypothetical protein